MKQYHGILQASVSFLQIYVAINNGDAVILPLIWSHFIDKDKLGITAIIIYPQIQDGSPINKFEGMIVTAISTPLKNSWHYHLKESIKKKNTLSCLPSKLVCTPSKLICSVSD